MPNGNSLKAQIILAIQNSLSNFSFSGQNKNRYVIGYFMWRVMTGRHDSIEYLMQIPGHARCLVDSGFASLKKLYRRSDCDTIGQLEDVVEKSSATNSAVRYPAWRWFNWKAFLEPVIKAVPGIRYTFELYKDLLFTSTTEYHSLNSAHCVRSKLVWSVIIFPNWLTR